jgi:hypothetical protein
MTFLSPWALLLAGLTLPLILLYFLKVRRQLYRVSSVMLWVPSRREQRAAAWFQRLKFDPLLLLQILALLLLTLALARPIIPVRGRSADRVVLVVDTSASMQARDVAPTRFHAAQARAAALVDEAGPGAEVMVIEAGAHAVVRVAVTRDHGRAPTALRAHTPRAPPAPGGGARRRGLRCGGRAGRPGPAGPLGDGRREHPECRDHAVRRPQALLRHVRLRGVRLADELRR